MRDKTDHLHYILYHFGVNAYFIMVVYTDVSNSWGENEGLGNGQRAEPQLLEHSSENKLQSLEIWEGFPQSTECSPSYLYNSTIAPADGMEMTNMILFG